MSNKNKKIQKQEAGKIKKSDLNVRIYRDYRYLDALTPLCGFLLAGAQTFV